MMSKTLINRVALVTGASRGIGRAVALELARQGAHIVALARTTGALEELDDEIKAVGGAATLVPLDLKDGAALDRLQPALAERWGKLDILVANAGLLGPLAPLAHISPKEWDDVMAVNVTANWRILKALDPLLRASDAGRVVVLSSGAAHSCRAYWGLYAASKAAVEVLARSYAAETETTPIKTMIVNPGPLRTKMRALAMPGEDPMELRTPDEIAPKIAELCQPDWTMSGLLYDFPQDKVLTPQRPA
jgi:NAD(P)-dependent dehydrogenase (short-subunit alcohol dehydrogenase family)